MSSAGAAPSPALVAGAGYGPCTPPSTESCRVDAQGVTGQELSLSSQWDIVVHVCDTECGDTIWVCI